MGISMSINSSFVQILQGRWLIALLVTQALFTGCTIAPPSISTSPNDPSNPDAAEAASAPLRPGLVAGAKTYLSTKEGADAQKMQHGDMKGMSGMGGMEQGKMEGMDHSKMGGMEQGKMEGMDHGKMGGMGEMSGKAGAPQNQAEQKVAAEVKQEASPAVPTSEQLQSMHPIDYTCPMHPEVHSDKPGQCPKCGMTLVSRESLEKNKAMEEKKP